MNQRVMALNGLTSTVRKVDRVLAAIVLLFIGIFVLLPDQVATSFRFTLDSVAGTAPVILLSAAVAAYAKATGLDNLIAVALQKNGHVAIVLAALIGGLSPLCSCGVIPLMAGLLAAGVPLAPVLAFAMASPIMDPQMFVITADGLGLEFAVVKTMTAISMGLLAGYATDAVVRSGGFADILRPDLKVGCAARSTLSGNHKIVLPFWRESDRRTVFQDEVLRSCWFLFKWLTLAFALESLMVAYLPADLVASWLGGDSFWAIPLSVIVGVPAYLNGYAAVPVVAGLMDMGMSAGAGLAFLTAGGVTSIPAAIAVFALVKKPAFFWYIFLALTGSAVAGMTYGMFVGL